MTEAIDVEEIVAQYDAAVRHARWREAVEINVGIIADWRAKKAEIERLLQAQPTIEAAEVMRAKCEQKLRDMADHAETHCVSYRLIHRRNEVAIAFDRAADAIAALKP